MRVRALQSLALWMSLVGMVAVSSSSARAQQTEAPAPAPAADAPAAAEKAPADKAAPAEDKATQPGAETPAPAAAAPTGEASSPAPADTPPADAAGGEGEEEFEEFDDFSDVELDDDDADLLAGDDADDGAPSSFERQIVGYVAAGVAVVALAVGIGLGSYALIRYQCLQDVVACNEGADDPITGNEFFDAKANVEHLSLGADMAYLFAAAAALASVTSLVRAFFFTDDGDDDVAAAATPPDANAPAETSGGEVSSLHVPGGTAFAALMGGAE